MMTCPARRAASGPDPVGLQGDAGHRRRRSAVAVTTTVPDASSSTSACPTSTASSVPAPAPGGQPGAGADAPAATRCQTDRRPGRRRRRLFVKAVHTTSSRPACGAACGAPAARARDGGCRLPSSSSTAPSRRRRFGARSFELTRTEFAARAVAAQSAAGAAPHSSMTGVWGYDFGPPQCHWRVYVGYLPGASSRMPAPGRDPHGSGGGLRLGSRRMSP